MAPYRILKQGYMLKEPPASKRGMRKKLRRYWFVLLEDKKQVAFVYYKNEEAYIARQRNVGFIRIDNSQVNVIGDYLTHKNAFVIVTEKSKYTFVCETRYELHDWIFVLHNTLEGFHRRMERVKVRMEHRQRAYSASSAASDSVQNPSSPTVPTPFHQAGVGATPTEKKTPPSPQITPNRTPPIGSPRSRASCSRRPRRPAPVAPCKETTPAAAEISHTHNHTRPALPPRQYSHEGTTFQFMSQTPSSPYGTMESGHQLLDLEVNQMVEDLQREEAETVVEGEREWEREMEEVRDWEREDRTECTWERDVATEMIPQDVQNDPKPHPNHQRSISDTSILLSRTNSSSLPELIDHTSSTSPELIPDTVECARQQISQEAPTKRFRTKHTRHLSLLSGREVKRKKRRSAQFRCRSPPNYPPPPPPANEDSADEVETQRGCHTRKDSFGFSKVMQTISSIDHELQEMGGVADTNTTPNISPPMRFKAINPRQSPLHNSLEREQGEREGVISSLDTPGEEEGNGHDMQIFGEQEGGHVPSLQKDEIPTTGIFTTQDSTTDIIVPFSPTASSPTKKTPPPIAAKPKQKPKPKKNKVMFKEEVEDIPSYEPRIDDEEAPSTAEVEEGPDENIPSSVAGLKKMLFGQEQTQKYSKEGPMSLRFGAIVNTDDYDEDLHEMLSLTKQHMSPPPENNSTHQEPDQDVSSHYQHLENFTNIQQNTTPDKEAVVHSLVAVEQQTSSPYVNEAQENEYDTPWDSKPISKYSVIGRKQTPSPAQKAEPFEVVTHTTAVPGNMEWRNVHSLERQLRTDSASSRVSPRQEYGYPVDNAAASQPAHSLQFSDTLDIHDSDLLQSISSTLQSRSKYGSESLLTSYSQGDIPANYYQQQAQAELKQRGNSRSTRTELEKIRTQHRKMSITLPTTYTGYQDNKLDQRKALSRSYQSVNRGSSGNIAGGSSGNIAGGSSGEGKRKRVPLAQHKGARKAQSVDALQVDPATLVTYNTYTQSHTLQSLV